jgi:hypothetical protein
MRRTQDYLHAYRGISGGAGRCRVCVYEEEGRDPVVVVTALRSDPEVSISSVAPYLAAEVIARHFPDRLQKDLLLRWFEHYERSQWELKRLLPEFFQVEFSSYRPYPSDDPDGSRLRIGRPQWTRVPRETIEDLIEQPLD